jgi:hypothetical protein
MTQFVSARKNNDVLVSIPETMTLLRFFVFDFADSFGPDRAVAHIINMFERMAPLIKLIPADGTDEDTTSTQVLFIQKLLLCARGGHNAETKLEYLQRYLREAPVSLAA